MSKLNLLTLYILRKIKEYVIYSLEIYICLH